MPGNVDYSTMERIGHPVGVSTLCEDGHCLEEEALGSKEMGPRRNSNLSPYAKLVNG